MIVDLQLGMSQSQLALAASNRRVEGVEAQLAEARAELVLKRAEVLENEGTLDAYRWVGKALYCCFHSAS